MKKISLLILMGALGVGGVHAQDAATQQQIDKLSGQIQDILETEATQSKRMESLEHEISQLRDKINAPAVNNYASAEDVQKLAQQLREIDRKRQDDKEVILDKIAEVAKLSAAAPVHPRHLAPPPKDTPDETPPKGYDTAATPQKGYEYKVQAGDSLSAIIKAYKEKGVKITLSQVLKANPGLSANTLLVGRTIFIPDASAK